MKSTFYFSGNSPFTFTFARGSDARVIVMKDRDGKEFSMSRIEFNFRRKMGEFGRV